MLITILIFVLVLGVLVFVHELGHFVVARRNGIRCYEFGFGFPPRIVGMQRTVDPKNNQKKWRVIWGRHDGDDENEMVDIEKIEKEGLKEGTIYSLNWIPIGGFVRIKGEDGGHKKDTDSFAAKSAWTRTRVLAAGVTMNFLLAWFFMAIALTSGVPTEFLELVDNSTKIVISQVMPGTPAEQAGFKAGDEILKNQGNVAFGGISSFIQYVTAQKGKEISLKINRSGQTYDFKVTPRVDVPADQGPLGISFDTSIKSFPWYTAIWKGLLGVLNLIWLIITTLFDLLKNFLMGHKVNADVAGPIGIASMTRQAADAGWVSLILFTSFLSVNLGIINILPIPALDGGRILFVVIEKIKGSPVNERLETTMHTVFFFLLLFMMAVISIKEVTTWIVKRFG